jgi:hypothetical protein
MKLFNINLNINSTKNILKFLLLAFIVILCIYILYISSLSTIEAFAESKDCSNCQIMPSSGNCVKLYEFSGNNLDIYNNSDTLTTYLSGSNNKKLPDLSFIDTNYIFCPYEQKCNFKNIIDNRNESGEIIDITCCSGQWLNNEISNFQSINFVSDLNTTCNIINKNINEYMDSIKGETTIFDTDILDIFPDSYFNVRSICNNYKNNDMSGMLFKRDISSSGHVLADPKLLPNSSDTNDRIQSVQELLDAQKMLSLPMEKKGINYTVFENGSKITKTRFETGVSGEILKKINELNDELKNLNPIRNDFDTVFRRIQQDLSNIYIDSCGNPLIEYIDYNYTPYNNELQEISPPSSANVQSYILNEDEFLNCFGDVSDNKDMNFNNNDFSRNLFSLGRENAFGVSEDASYSTQQDLQSNKYGDIIDLSAEFRHLENVDIGGTAPTGVINQYLRAINGFYEKQMANMLGPRTHALNQQLVFDNDGLETKESTFFVYENKPNNEYECQPSITGNDKFKDCGPSAYYSEFKT